VVRKNDSSVGPLINARTTYSIRRKKHTQQCQQELDTYEPDIPPDHGKNFFHDLSPHASADEAADKAADKAANKATDKATDKADDEAADSREMADVQLQNTDVSAEEEQQCIMFSDPI
jgi:hypothetical protein